jgi:hypothetical protein
MQVVHVFWRENGSLALDRRNKLLERFKAKWRSNLTQEWLFKTWTVCGKRSKWHSERGLTKDKPHGH